MAIEFHDGKITGSSGVAKAALTLGIIGTGLSALGNGGGLGNLGGLLGGGTSRAEAEQSTIAFLESKIARLEAMRYTDMVGIDLYKQTIAQVKEEDAKIGALQKETFAFLIDLDKRTALNEQAQRLNREYDTMARDYMFTIMNNKIDCCCEKVNSKIDSNQKLVELADAGIVNFVTSNFIPGRLVLPASSICPPVVTQ
jgi:uncharacterized small protein (DUF1192 family)